MLHFDNIANGSLLVDYYWYDLTEETLNYQGVITDLSNAMAFDIKRTISEMIQNIKYGKGETINAKEFYKLLVTRLKEEEYQL